MLGPKKTQQIESMPFSGKEVLVVEDGALFCKRLTAFLKGKGAKVHPTATIAEAIQQLDKRNFDYTLLDVQLPDGNGLDLLREDKFSPNTAVIIMTGEGSTSLAVEAMRLGARDYLSKPFDFEELPIIFNRCDSILRQLRLKEHEQNKELKEETGFFFGKSLRTLQHQLDRIIEADHSIEINLPPVLIQGETGTGKTSIARWIHHNGPRAKHPFIEVNCATLPDSLAESELFGHEKGAFTDAKQSRMGLFEAANKGTLFLDEITSLSSAVQSKVLTAIEDRTIRRLGSNKSKPVDVKLITASIQDLRQLVASGDFREDLYHRLNLLLIQIPPLRARGDDIIALANQFLTQLTRKYKRPPISISKEGQKRLLSYSWPGNVRELSNELERSLILGNNDSLDFSYLSSLTGNDSTQPVVPPGTPLDWLHPDWQFPEKGFSLEEAIHRFIQMALEQTGNNVSAAGRLLDVPRDYIRYRLKKML